MRYHVKQTASVYNKISRLYTAAFHKTAEYMDEFLDLLPRGGKILDVGCGPGMDADCMASRGFQVCGIDVSQEMIHLARQRNPEIEFKLADMRRLDFEPASFDGVFVSFSLIHIPKKDTDQTVNNLCRLLKPGGVIYFSIQEGNSQEVIVSAPLKRDETMFLNVLSAAEMRETLRKNGFSILQEYQRKPKMGEHHFEKFFVLARPHFQNLLQ